jgi:predicted phosphodiesterase
MKTEFSKANIVKNYLRKFPNTPSMTIAKKIYAENSADFTNVEDARTKVRYQRGLSGNKHREKISDEFKVPKFTFENKYKFPKSDGVKPKVFHLPQKDNNILVLSDLHIPYHDIKALTVAFDYGKKENINTIFINGDLLDFYQISRFVNVERKRSVAEELQMAKEFLIVLRDTFPEASLYFLLGNHDTRLQHYLANKAPELLDVEEFQLEYLLEADKYKMKVIEDTTLVKMGKLAVTHGHLLIRGIFAPVSAARGAFLRAKASVMIGHTHKISTHSETTINSKVITCYSTGCLCELTPAYNPFGNNFTHGFSHVKVENGGHYRVRNLQIISGELIS